MKAKMFSEEGRMRLRLFCALFSLFLLAWRAEAQIDTTRYLIHYFDQSFLTNQPLPAFSDNLTVNGFTTDEAGYYFVQFTGPVTRGMKDQVTATGAALVEYVPNYTFICRMTDAQREQVEQLTAVQFVGIFQPGFKISNQLQNVLDGGLMPTPPAQGPGLVPMLTEPPVVPENLALSVSVFAGEDPNQVAQALQAQGARVLTVATSKILIEAGRNDVVALANINGVSRLDLQLRYQLHHDSARGAMNVASVQTGLSLTGTNQIVGIGDSGLDSGVDDATMHPDIQGNIAQIFSWPVQAYSGVVNAGADDGASDLNSGHGTHTTGSVMADGTQSGGLYAGVAPDATIVFQAIEQWTDQTGTANDGYSLSGIPFDLNDFFQQAYDAGARIHTNSWGAPVNGAYNANAQEVDEFVWDHPDMLIVYSAGNSGVDADGNGVIDQGSLGSPGTAKNCLTVGASENNRPSVTATYSNNYSNTVLHLDRVADNTGGLAAFSSRGPAATSRIKPDVVAPGTMVASTRSQQPFNILYSDDMESGVGGWSKTGAWSQVNTDAHSPTISWHDSPGGNYADNVDITLTSPTINLSGTSLLPRTLHFWCRVDLGTGDEWRLQVSSASVGSASVPIKGDQTQWEMFSIGLGPWDHASDLVLSFRLISDNDGNTGDGLYIDDVFITEGPYLTARLGDYNVKAPGSAEDNWYLLSNGTSMSTPLTAGVAALVREYYTETLDIDYVSAALLRATMINGAVDLTPGQYGSGATQEINGQPDNAQGWGFVDAENILLPAAPAQIDHIDEIAGLETGDIRNYTLTVSDNSVPLSVTMVYHDYPGTGLQNNLDMTITTPSGVTLFPNGLTSNDNFNNVERIVVASPQLGNYTIRINGQNVPQGPQPYAIATRAGGTLVHRPPVDVMLVLDLSGSMLSPACGTCDPKLDVLKDAVEIFTQLWSAIAVDGDEMGVTYFRTNVSNYAPGGDLLPPFDAGNIITDVRSQTTTGANLTAMGGGLQRAINNLTDATQTRSIILFTDGMQNVNPMVNSAVTPMVIDNSSGTSTMSNVPPTSPPTQLNTALDIKVNTIGVGATPAFTTLLNDVAVATDGVFKQTNAPDDDLRRFYVEELVDVLRDYSPQLIGYRSGQLGVSGSATEAFAVNNNVPQVIFKVSWQRGLDTKVQIRHNGADVTNLADVIAGEFYRIMTFDLGSLQANLGGNWEVAVSGRRGADYQIAAIVEEPGIDYSFSLGRNVYRVGQPLEMAANIMIEGRPVVSNVSVTATVLRPTTGIGTLLSTNKMPPNPTVTMEAGASIGQQKLAALSQQDAFFAQLQGTPQQLTLNHTGGGTYAADFPNTFVPGAYTIVFHIEGTHPLYGEFHRTEQLTVDVEFGNLDRDASGLLARAIGASDGGNKQYLISFRPVDGRGNFLGPDYGHKITVIANGRDLSRNLRDVGDGSYELQAALPADSQLEIAVIDEKLYEGPLADLVGGGGGLYGSLHLGYPFRKVGSGNVMGRFLIEADLEYRFAPDWGLQLIGGYYLFDKDDDVTGASLQLKRYFHLTPTTWTVYAEFGPGYYKPRHIDGAFALNGGVGIVRNIAPRLDLSLGGNYFRLFTSPTEIEFWGVKAGLHFRF